MKLSDLGPAQGSNNKRKRVGRGDGSGHGKTRAEATRDRAPGLEGERALVRRGPDASSGVFPSAVSIIPFELKRRSLILNNCFLPSGSEVTPALLVEKGLLRSKKGQDPQRRGPDEATDD